MIENRVRVRLCAMLQGRGEVRRKEDAKAWEKGIEKSPLAMGKWGFVDEELRCMDLTQIDEFLSVANIELAADGLRHFATVEIVDRGGIGVALYVLYGRDEEIAEQFRSGTGRLGDLNISLAGGDACSFYQTEANFLSICIVAHRIVSNRSTADSGCRNFGQRAFEIVLRRNRTGFCRHIERVITGGSGDDDCRVGRYHIADGRQLEYVLLCVDFTDICREACGKFHRLVTIVSGILHRRHGEGDYELEEAGRVGSICKVIAIVSHGENKRINRSVFIKC